MLDTHYCRLRQKRLLDRMRQRQLDAVVCGWGGHVYYLTGHWTSGLHQSAVVVFADGRTWLIGANEPPANVAADEVAAYEANWMGTQRQEQAAVVGRAVLGVLTSHKAARIGMDASIIGSQVAMELEADCEAIDPELWQLRRRKDPDELALMQAAIRCTEAMYRRGRQIIEPGVAELDVFGELHKAAVETAGEPLTALLGNDFAGGAAGGPPRKDRQAQAGQLYILDLGPGYRGYFADNARTFSVDRKPTEVQMRAWEAVAGCLKVVEDLARPGVRCRAVFEAVDEFLRDAWGQGMQHHLGHGVGLQPHEYPHLNPRWDDVLMEGEVFTAEPGVYGPELAAGIRMENQYLVTAEGVKNLVEYPLEMV
jgi:Xaa-Pro aminopeptidase